jgi:hypothetical protein
MPCLRSAICCSWIRFSPAYSYTQVMVFRPPRASRPPNTLCALYVSVHTMVRYRTENQCATEQTTDASSLILNRRVTFRCCPRMYA